MNEIQDVMCEEEAMLFKRLQVRRRKNKYLYRHGKISREKFLANNDKLLEDLDALEKRFDEIYANEKATHNVQ